MSPLPVAQTDQVVALANALSEKNTPPSSFDLARLDREIRRLADTDPAASQCFRGVYYALQGDLANTTKWFNMALSLAPNHPYVYLNYAFALNRLGQHEQAVKMALESINKGGYSPETLSNLLVYAYNADDRATLDEWLLKYAKLTGSPHEIVSWLQEDAEDEAELPAILKEAEKEGYVPLSKIKEELGL